MSYIAPSTDFSPAFATTSFFAIITNRYSLIRLGINSIRRLSLGSATIHYLRSLLALLPSILRLRGLRRHSQLVPLRAHWTYSHPAANPASRPQPALQRSPRLHPEDGRSAWRRFAKCIPGGACHGAEGSASVWRLVLCLWVDDECGCRQKWREKRGNQSVESGWLWRPGGWGAVVVELSVRCGEEQDAEWWLRSWEEVCGDERLFRADLAGGRVEGVLEGNWPDAGQGVACERGDLCGVRNKHFLFPPAIFLLFLSYLILVGPFDNGFAAFLLSFVQHCANWWEIRCEMTMRAINWGTYIPRS